MRIRGLAILGLLSLACRRGESVATDAASTGETAGVADVAGLDATDSPTDSITGEWEPVPGWEQCQVFARRGGLNAIPARKWTACGPGCSTAPAATPGWGKGFAPVAAGATRDSEVLLKTGSVEPTHALQLSRLSDGATLALLEIRGPVAECGALAADNVNAPELFGLYGGKPPAVGAVRVVDGIPLASAVRDLSGKITVDQFAFGATGWGIGARSGIYFAADSAAVTLKQLAVGEPFGTTSQGTTVFWSQVTGDSSALKVSFDGQAPRELVGTTSEGAPILPAVGAGRLAWMAVSGPDRFGGVYTGERLAWSEALPTPTGSAVVAVFGPALPAGWVSAPRVGPGHVAVVLCVTGSDGCALVVAETSTKKAWSIPARPTMRWRRVLAMSAGELVALEASVDAPSWAADSIVRFDLASLATAGAPI